LTIDRERLTRTTKLIYGSGELLNGTSTVIILMLYLKFLTDVVGLSPMLAGVCLVAGKLWDALSDPLLGAISDRTRTRFGRRRVFFLACAVPASLAFAAMWVDLQSGSRTLMVVYYAVAYVAFKTLATALNVPYQALGPELTDDYNERTSLVAYRMAFSLGGAIVAGTVPHLVVTRFAAAGEPVLGHLLVAGGFGLLYVLCWWLIFARIAERPVPGCPERPPFFRALALTLRGRSFRMLIGLYLCAFLALDGLTAAAKFFVEEYLGDPRLMTLVMGGMLGTALLSVPVYYKLIARFERRGALAAGLLLWILGLGLLGLVRPESSWVLLLAAMALVGGGAAAAFVVPWSALPEVIDVDRLVNGRAQEGIFSGVMTFLRKLSTTGALFLISIALDLTGYCPPGEAVAAGQPESTLLAIRLLTVAVPAALLCLGLVFTLRYPIDRRLYSLIRRRLDVGDGALESAEQEELAQGLGRAY